jgi:hypothetical protein
LSVIYSLTQTQIALFFGTQRPAITKHLKNIFSSGELDENSVGSILEHTAKDGKIYQTQFYSLDAIISVGYRVNSQIETQFRIWALERLFPKRLRPKRKALAAIRAKPAGTGTDGAHHPSGRRCRNPATHRGKGPAPYYFKIHPKRYNQPIETKNAPEKV